MQGTCRASGTQTEGAVEYREQVPSQGRQAQFSVSMVNGKFAKRLGEHDRAQGNGMKTVLAAMEKNLRMALFGTNDTDIDDKACAKLCDDAKTWHESALQLVAASAATL